MENIESEIKNIEAWIRDFMLGAKATGVVVGISGGKDSLIAAKLCAEALGAQNVLGLILPNGKMKDLGVAEECCKCLGIRHHKIDISESVNAILSQTSEIAGREGTKLSTISSFNVPPRVRMATLYSVAGSLNYLVVNTSNLSEASTGYTTKWGDNVGDFSPLGSFTKTEVCELGVALGLPEHLVFKAPDDGISGVTDEENLGVSYDEIDKFIRTGASEKKDKILALYRASAHKRRGVATYQSGLKNYLKSDKVD